MLPSLAYENIIELHAVMVSGRTFLAALWTHIDLKSVRAVIRTAGALTRFLEIGLMELFCHSHVVFWRSFGFSFNLDF